MPNVGPTTIRATSRILDVYLVASAKVGDRSAFEQLARRWHRKLVAHAWRLTGDGDAAADAAQAAWIEIARGLPKLRDERAFPAWAYRIVSRQCVRRIRGLQRERLLSSELAEEPAPAASGTADWSEAEVRRLRAAIRSLPPAQRAAVALFHLEDMSIAEVAVALDVPAGTVKTRLMHARRTLRRVLEGDPDAQS
jgi:RNA polymerase sigma-70 factor (ECF subfamily)